MCCVAALGQPIHEEERRIIFVNYSVADGLPDNQVNCLLQDEEGFIWIGTNSGLCRFDGHHFEIFTRKSTNGHLPGNRITALVKNPEGGFWIGTADGGPCRYEQHFTPVNLITAGCNSPQVNAIYHDSRNERVYFGMNRGGIFCADVLGNNPKKIALLQENAVISFLETEQGFYFAQPGQSIQEYRGDSLIRAQQNFVFPAATHTASCFLRDTSGIVWFGSWTDHFYRMDRFNVQYTPIPLYSKSPPGEETNEVTCMAQDHSGKLWMGSKHDGIFIYHIASGTIQHVNSERTDPFSLRGNKIHAILKDKDGRMWVAGNGGVSVSDPLRPAFEVHWISRDNDNQVLTFVELNGSVWAGTEKGLIHTETLEEKLTNLGKLTLLHPLSNGRLLIGSDRTLVHADTKTLEPKRWSVTATDRIDFENLPSSRYTSAEELIFRGKKGILVTAFGHGALLIHSDSLSFSEATINDEPENLIRKIVRSPDSTLWIVGASHGLLRMHPERFGTSLYGSAVGRYVAFPCDTISSSSGILDVYDFIPEGTGGYLSTRGRGIQKLKSHSESFSFEEIPVPVTSPGGIALSPENQLWIICSSGIARYDQTHKQYQLFGKESGIPTEGLEGYFFTDSRGRLYCGGNGFFIRFNPLDIQSAGLHPTCKFTGMEVNGVKADSLLLLKSVELSPDQNALAFRCASLLYTNSGQVRFFYKLIGSSTDWIDNGPNPVIRFAGLAPGKYTLQVKTRSGDGLWSEQSAQFEFEINPRFYQSLWFYLLLLALTGLLFYAAYQYRLKQLKAIELIRNKIARDLHDDIGSALGSISYLGTAAERNLNQSQLDQAHRAIVRIGETSRQTIDNMHDIVWAVNTAGADGSELMDRIRNYGSDLCAAHEISFEWQSVGVPEQIAFSMTERKNIYLIAKEALYNAVKYSSCSVIRVQVNASQSEPFALTIADNGKGFDTTSKYSGIGLRSMKLRADEITGELHINSTSNGTVVTFILRK